MTKPAEHLLVTEVTTSRQHKIPLSKIRVSPITIGRSNDADITIGRDTDAYGWISKLHCTLFAASRQNDSSEWDYYIQDGYNDNGHWIPSQQGLWVGGRQQPPDLPIQLRPGPGHIEIFPRLAGLKYRCLLEWPVEPGPEDDTDKEPPTLQQYEAVLMERRVFQEQADHNRQQLERLAKNMAYMQAQFTQERETLDSKIDEQSTLLLELSTTLEEERLLNEQQQTQLTEQQQRNKRVRLSILMLSAIVFAIAILALKVDQESWKELLEWALLIVSVLGAGFGVKID